MPEILSHLLEVVGLLVNDGKGGTDVKSNRDPPLIGVACVSQEGSHASHSKGLWHSVGKLFFTGQRHATDDNVK